MNRRKLPNAQDAWIEEGKLKGYLLNESHPKGRAKARFFRARGFSDQDWEGMADALRHHARHNEIVAERPSAYGVNYALDCHVPTPDRSNPCIRTVWEIRTEDSRPRLITAHPLDA